MLAKLIFLVATTFLLLQCASANKTEQTSHHETEQQNEDYELSKQQRFIDTGILRYADYHLSFYKNLLSSVIAELTAQDEQSQQEKIAELKKLIQRIESYQSDILEAVLLLIHSPPVVEAALMDPVVWVKLLEKGIQLNYEARDFMLEFGDNVEKYWNSLNPEERDEQEDFGVWLQKFRLADHSQKLKLFRNLISERCEIFQIFTAGTIDQLLDGIIPVYKEVLEYVLSDLSALHNKNLTVEENIIKIEDILRRMDQAVLYKEKGHLLEELVEWMRLDTSGAFITNSLNERSMSGYLAEKLSPIVNRYLKAVIRKWNLLSSDDKMSKGNIDMYTTIKKAEAETDVEKQIFIILHE